MVALALIPVGYRYQGVSGAAMALVTGEFAVLVDIRTDGMMSHHGLVPALVCQAIP